MVEERSTPRSAWLHQARASLETIATAYQRHLAESAELDCTPAVRELARIARANDVGPEHVLVELKRSLEDCGPIRCSGTAARGARERLVKIAIRAYYATDG